MGEFTSPMQIEVDGVSHETLFRGGISEKWALKTVWGVGYKFEVV
jgi:hypothetical protein